jgi:hypothetical protein
MEVQVCLLRFDAFLLRLTNLISQPRSLGQPAGSCQGPARTLLEHHDVLRRPSGDYSFLSHAPAKSLTRSQSCIGQRFSIIEMKSFLYILLCSFEFSPTEEQVYKANV